MFSKIEVSRFFWIALGVSVASLAISAFFSAPPFWVFTLGFIPLIAYHFRLYEEAKKGASQNAIDSVYYFGFIVTIATLAASVLVIATRGVTKDIGHVVTQFGLGLVATGYALFARMHLMAVAERIDESRPDQLIDEYIHKIKRVVDQVELSALSFESLTNSLIERTSKSAQTSSDAAQEIVHAAAATFQSAMHLSTEEAKGSIKSFSNSLDGIKLGSDVEALKSQLSSAGAAFVAISKRLKSFDSSLGDLDDLFSKANGPVESFTSSLSKANNGVKGISTLNVELSRLRQTMEMTAHRTESLQEGLTNVESGFSNLAKEIEKSVANVALSLDASNKLATESVNRLTVHLTRLVDFIIAETKRKHS